ncbi:ribose-phosphate diphosphokinase [Chitinophaga sp. NPDC101104]|uniref:ribose-phosphate diphosphokinase n=1 Tax=Chitinophaga sp. NPDC101104 TaxID=3390561 RepID=UPI003CFDDBD3
MLTLHLIHPEKSDIPVETLRFPDGQPHLKIDTSAIALIERQTPVRILTRLNDGNDLLMLLFAQQALSHLEFRDVRADITYLTSARMDRVMRPGEPFSLKVIAAVLNAAQFRKVRIFDPHSEVTTALIDRAYAVENHRFMRDVLEDYNMRRPGEQIVLVSPDGGALKKIYSLAKFTGTTDVVECMKTRDVKTGALSGFKTSAEDLSGKTCIIADDICDGGGTFAGTAKVLKDKGASRVVLAVSHGIFSKGTSIEYVDEIYTTDSFREVPDVHCFAAERYFH